ncbi:MAG: DUF1850 domain-containing protein [Treponema sp.]|jgi:hypothetical protein|nr:DUF1850 domain-containing protein [Treponema sp.]
MKFRRWSGILINGILAGFVIAAGAARLGRASLRLSITDQDSHKRYIQWTVKDEDIFAIEFIHSVNNSPVKETFMITGPEIRPIASRFSAVGAGIQTELEEPQVLIRDGEFLVITGFSNSYKELNYIVGTVSDHILYIHNQVISLRDLCGKNAHITIRVKRGVL